MAHGLTRESISGQGLSCSGLLPAETVARVILRDAARGRYIILPGLETKFLYHLGNLLGNGVYPIMDWLIARARKETPKR